MTPRCPAAGILDQALSRRYRLPRHTRGFRADLRVHVPDRGVVSGDVHLGCGVHVATRLKGAPPPVVRWVTHELRTWAQEAWPRPFSAAEGRYEIHVHRGEDGSQLARLAGEATGTCFRLRDGRAVERLRALGDTRVSSTVTAWKQAEDGRDLPIGETVHVTDVATGQALRTEDRTTVWTPEAPHLPLWRVVTVRDATGTRTWRIRFLRPAILLPDGPAGGR